MTSNAQAWVLLQECAAGYGLFEVVAFEEIGSLLEGSMNTVTELARFSRAVKLKAFYPFESAVEALVNINAISDHAMTPTLQSFLEMNLLSDGVGVTKKKKKKSSKSTSSSGSGTPPTVLGVLEPGLATAISEGLPHISCRSDETVRELQRGIRCHLHHYIRGLEHGGLEQAQLGLGHSYSRSKVKFNPARSDNMIIQSIALLDQLDKDLNTFAMRVREWYSWHFPELKDIVKDNYMFARCAAYIQNKSSLFKSASSTAGEEEEEGEEDPKKQLLLQRNGDGPTITTNNKLDGLQEIVGDANLVESIVAAAKTSMGMDCSAIDMVNIVNFTQRMIKMAEFRKQLAFYLSDKMSVVAPNLSTLLGDTVAARLISKVRTLKEREKEKIRNLYLI
jgi:nucleolar protein 56